MGMKTKRTPSAKGRIGPRSRERLVALAQAFVNKAGRYELVRVDGETAFYTFTNHQGQRADATMTVMTWRRLQERAEPQPGSAPSALLLSSLVVCLVVLLAVPGSADQSTPSTAAKAVAADDPSTRSFTLPGSHPGANPPGSERLPSSGLEPEPDPKGPAPEVVAASLALVASSGDQQAEPHYRTAVLALKREDLGVAAEEMTEAAKVAPENALVLYGLAVIQARNQQPELALPNMEKAMTLGLPPAESARATDLIASIRYAIKKNEAEQKRVTPVKLWGTYDTALDEPTQQFDERAGKTIFKTRTLLSREMFLWKVDGEATVRGHWLEKDTVTEETIYADPRRHDPKPKTNTAEHWWLVTILINPDGSLDGSRMETCTRPVNLGCETEDPDRGRAITFKGRVEPNGDLTITQGDADQALTLRKKSRVASLPPPEVHIPME